MSSVTVRLAALCVAALSPITAATQSPDTAIMNKWAKVNLIHYEVVGEITLKGFQLPADDADLYGDVTERVRLSFDWDKKKGVMVGAPVITNEPAKVANLAGLEKFEPGSKPCPKGKLNGPFEYFDVIEVKQAKPGAALQLIGKRIHPETQVSEACGSKLKTYKGATRDVKEHIGVPDPMILAMGGVGNVKTIQVTPDKKSIVMTALNHKWVWTFTPTPK
ncbi:MAG: hypothetical protein SF172_15955 [Burkholderiales bacterium]|nr:hypothetical protein [Burkholderiales bacterium]